MVQNVVVIGLGPAGIKVATTIAAGLPATHRVVAIDAAYFGFWPGSSLRSAVAPGWEDKSTVTFDKVFPKDSRHVVVAGTKVLALNEHSVSVDVEHGELGFGREIPFDYAVIATGSTYAFPCRPPSGAMNRSEVGSAFKSAQKDIKSASSILVVGGGPTGVEFAGEVATAYPEKSVALAHAHASLFDVDGFNPKLGGNLAGQLRNLGVKLFFNTKVDAGSLVSGPIPKTTFYLNGKQVEADYVLFATGAKPNTKVFSRNLVDSKGFLRVLPTLQLEDAYLHHVYAIGDVTNVPEMKTAANANFQLPTIVANILASIKSGEKASLKNHKPSKPMLMVTTGPTGGSGQAFGWVLGSFFARMLKSKTLMVPMIQESYHFKE